jgi:hypothetical protein
MAAAACAAIAIVACDSDPAAPSGGCTKTEECPLGQLCNTMTHVCQDEPQDGFAGHFECNVYDQAATDPTDYTSVTDVVGTVGPTRYAFYLGVSCIAYPMAPTPFIDLTFASVDLANVSEALTLLLPWPADADVDLTRSTSDHTIGSGFAHGRFGSDKAYDPHDGYVTGGHIHFDPAPMIGGRVSGFLDLKVATTAAMQQPLLSDCSGVGPAACGPIIDSTCSSFGRMADTAACTFECFTQADCDPYGGFCNTTAGLCTKLCGSAADCPSWMSCSAVGMAPQTICN